MALALIGTALAGAVNMYTCFGALSLAAALGTTSAIIAVHDKRFEDIVDAIYFFPSHANNLSRTDMHVLRGMLAEPTSEPGRVVFRNGDFVATGTIAAEVVRYLLTTTDPTHPTDLSVILTPQSCRTKD